MTDLRMNREALPIQTGTYLSSALGCEQSYTYIAPAAWNGELDAVTTRYPLFVLLHGRNSDHTQWARYTRLARYAAAYALVFVCPDGGNSWYTNAADGSARREDDIIQDFLPHIQETLPILASGKAWGIGGLSMGGYGAVKLALKYPRLFSLAVGHSGAYDKMKTPKPDPVFGDPEADAALRRAENPYSLAELAMCRWPTERPRLFLDCGESDPLVESSRRFRDHLNFIGYPYLYEELPGQHTWPYWDRAFRTVLPAVAQALGAKSAQE